MTRPAGGASGWVLFLNEAGHTAKRYAFYEAALVWLEFRHDATGTAGKQAATEVELHFAPATVEVDGQRIEAYSVVPWKTDPQTSFRALTKPADPLPSAHLRASGSIGANTNSALPEIFKSILADDADTAYAYRMGSHLTGVKTVSGRELHANDVLRDSTNSARWKVKRTWHRRGGGVSVGHSFAYVGS